MEKSDRILHNFALMAAAAGSTVLCASYYLIERDTAAQASLDARNTYQLAQIDSAPLRRAEDALKHIALNGHWNAAGKRCSLR